MEIPVSVKTDTDYLLAKYIKSSSHPTDTDVWTTYFRQTLEAWSSSWSKERVQEVRNWIYMCLQRNLRWTDVVRYWMEAIYGADWIDPAVRSTLMEVLWRAESGSGWVLVTSYRIPILWESVHLELARTLYKCRQKM
jgi:hypothetical protein